MGGGIALVVAQIAKKEVVVIDVNDSVLKNCQKFLESLLKKNVDKGKMTEDLKKTNVNEIVIYF